ncbi:MAG: ATP phosphoribosyltransferase regulatory subunit [Clostridiales bacterium]|nr:ATP phosphoribosyltransferase regulatory subunit [Clostridiales bacterium]MBR6487627.1 ATP phosphoribosyltransferase regulatory subunit [Clostridiales bacterium]
MGNKFYTPDGFTDQLPGVCAFKRELEARLRNLFLMNGYDEIETPGIEYFDVYKSFVAEEELYKFTDGKGRLLCTRYDGTIPVARYAAGRNDTLPIRLSYIENMYRAGQIGGGKQSGFTQAGIELLGASGSKSDAEVLALAIKSALELGLTDLQVSVGQVQFFKGLSRQLGLSGETIAKVKAAISNRDSVTIEKLDLSREDKDTLLMITESGGTYDTIDNMLPRVTDEGAKAALGNIKEILDIMERYGYLKYVSVDLGLIESIDYYTGMVFKGYTYEVGFPVFGGGRYDDVSKTFGKDMAAVGFSISLTLAITALMRQDKFTPAAGATVIVGGDFETAIATAEALRAEGTAAVLDTTGMTEEELDSYAKARGIETIMYMNGGEA